MGPSDNEVVEAIELIRAAPLERLESQQWLENEMVPALGFPEHAARFLPAALSHRCGRGLQSFQSPNQFSRYLRFLAERRIESYLEVGTYQGGTFIATVEYLSRFRPVVKALGVDIRIRPNLLHYAKSNPAVELHQGTVESPAVVEVLHSHTWDLALIDGDHSEEGCWRDYEAIREHARLVAFHDTFNVKFPGVGAVWERVKRDSPLSVHEFHDQYDELAETGKHYFGIAVVELEGEPTPSKAATQ